MKFVIQEYSPSSLVNIFNNALTIEATKKAFRIRGIYLPGKGVAYNGLYYDSLKDESSDACVTLIVPGVVRHDLTPQQTVEFTGYLTKKVQANVGKIELHVNLIELISQQQSKYTEEQIKIFDVLQKKAEHGYKDVDAFIKTRIIQQRPITVTIVVGKTAIIDSDIKHSLKEAIGFYDFRFERINLSSEMEIINALRRYSNDSGILVISRGGGENMEVYNKVSLAEEALTLKCPFLTAIGHKQDTPLLQKIADKFFITPTELGQYFNEMYNKTIEELQNSKAKLIDDMSKQFENNYQEKLKNLAHQLEGNKQLNEKQIQLVNDQMNEYKNRLAKKQSMNIILWILVIVACVVGIIIGKFVVFRF